MSTFLTDTQLAEIAWTSDEETTGDLADRLGVTYAAERFSRKRLRAEGFVCRLYWVTCRRCGGMLAERRHAQAFHDHCGAHHTQEYIERYRARDEVKARRAACLAANTDRTREHQVRRAVKVKRAQLRTEQTALRHRERWTPEEDALVRNAKRRDHLEAVALAVGRSYKRVLSRRAALLSAELIAVACKTHHNRPRSFDIGEGLRCDRG